MRSKANQGIMARKKKTTEEIKEAAKETVDEKVSSDATKEEEDDGAKDEENEDTLQEVWDVVHTLNCSESELICRMDKCKRAAVVVWATDANPDDKWPLCEVRRLSTAVRCSQHCSISRHESNVCFLYHHIAMPRKGIWRLAGRNPAACVHRQRQEERDGRCRRRN